MVVHGQQGSPRRPLGDGPEADRLTVCLPAGSAGALALVPLTRSWAQAVSADSPGEFAWAAGFPTEGDRQVSGWVLEGRRRTPSRGRPWGPWVMLLDGAAIGGVGFHEPPELDPEGWVELGYGIAEPFRGRGLTTACVRALIEVAAEAGVTRIRATCLPGNLASGRVLAKAGLIRAGSDEDGEDLWVLPSPSA